MGDVRGVAERFLDAFYAGDREGARRFLDEQLTFAGPGTSREGADGLLAFAAHAAGGVRGVRHRRAFVDGDEVCLLYDLLLRGGVPSIPVAQWFRFRDDRIASIEMIFDTGPFAAKPGAATATDPVCGMAVNVEAPPATRVHVGVTYYFCGAGCAEAFARAPEKYLPPAR